MFFLYMAANIYDWISLKIQLVLAHRAHITEICWIYVKISGDWVVIEKC